jgi:hypothetical protein
MTPTRAEQPGAAAADDGRPAAPADEEHAAKFDRRRRRPWYRLACVDSMSGANEDEQERRQEGER